MNCLLMMSLIIAILLIIWRFVPKEEDHIDQDRPDKDDDDLDNDQRKLDIILSIG